MDSFDWLDEVELEAVLDKDTKMIYQHCGKDVLLSLWRNLPGINVYISLLPLVEARRQYIEKHFNGANHKELAILLKVTMQTIYNDVHIIRTRKQSAQKQTEQQSLFGNTGT